MDLNTFLLALILLALLKPFPTRLHPHLDRLTIPPSLEHEAERLRTQTQNFVSQVCALILEQSNTPKGALRA